MGYSAEVIKRARQRLEQARADREAENRQHLQPVDRDVHLHRDNDMDQYCTLSKGSQQ